MNFVQAKWYTSASRTAADIQLVVIHDMEYPERVTAAEDCAAFFAGGSVRASAHYCVDSNSEVQCVLDKDVAFAAPRINHNGIHIEHAGYASQTAAQWLDAYGQAMLLRSAQLTANLCKKYNIPAVWVDEAGLLSGKRGITDHATSTRAFNIVGGHMDPGPNFPRSTYLKYVNDFLAPPKEWDEMATKAEIKAAVREVLDEHNTQKRVDVIFENVDKAEFSADFPEREGQLTLRKMVTGLYQKVVQGQ